MRRPIASLALALARIFLSGFNHLFGKDLIFHPDLLLLALCGGSLVVGTAAGAYPAFVLSRLRPMSVLSGSGRRAVGGNGRVRQSLVVFQFAIAVALIVGTLVIHRQLDYAQQKNLGFDGEQVVGVDLRMAPFWGMREDLQRRASNHASVASATVANAAPASVGVRLGFKGSELSPEAREPDESVMFVPSVVDFDFIETLGLKIIAGRDFDRDRISDRSEAYILNRKAVELMGWTVDDAVGRPFSTEPGGDEDEGAQTFGTVIGVVEDFHIRSLHSEIEPMVLQAHDSRSWSSPPVLLARLRPDGIRGGLEHLESVFKAIAPDQTFTYEFLDDQFDAMYREEARLGSIFSSFAGLAVFLACLGLFGLSAYAAESRTKEIGIRKVLGASVSDVIALLSRSFLVLVAIGFVIAGPVAYLMMDRWLDDFAYRIDVSPILIVAVGVATLSLALATVIYQAMKAALRNPTESLRYE